MMSTLAQIFGWTPPENEDYVQVTVHLPSLGSLQNPPFHISDATNTAVRNLRSRSSRSFSSKMESRSPTSSPSSEGESHLDKRQEAGKNGDPTWVARPRNEFILFRCEYVKMHSKGGKRIRRPPGAGAEKTLSKQAAEAWHQLSQEERIYWRDRANGERNEHARRYPDYRYRPKKSATSRKRNTRSSSTEVPSGKSASTAATAAVAVTVNTGVGGTQQMYSRASEKPSKSDSALRAARRKSSSVPLLLEHQTNVKSKEQTSVTTHARWMNGLAPPYSSISISEVCAMLPIKTETKDSQSLSSRIYHSASFDSFTTSDYSSALPSMTNSASASSSLLLNWNGGESVVESPASHTGAQFLMSPSSLPLSLPPLAIFEDNAVLSQHAKYPNLVVQSQRLGLEMSNMPELFTEGLLHNATNGQAMLEVPSVVYDESGHAHLVNEYGVSTQEPVPMELRLGQDNSPDVLFAMDTEEYFPRF